jgi:molybdopterin-guanine dinucleotide biosynthesis protein A
MVLPMPDLQKSHHLTLADCTALVMAGGDSRRMGQDKANLILGEQTLLQNVATKMAGLFPQTLISVRQLRQEFEWPQICDDPAYRGPLAGLLAGLEHSDTPWIFAIACDMPFITLSLIECLSQYRQGVDAVVPMVQDYPQPLAAFYAKASIPATRHILQTSGKHSMRALLEHLNVRYVGTAEMQHADPALKSFVDLDTPQDWTQALNPMLITSSSRR